MVERISGDALYVTHEKMNGYLTALLGGACAMVLTTVGATWFLNDKISEIRQDVAVIKVQVGSLHAAAPHETQDVSQAQYVLVQLPSGESALRDARVRDILKAQLGE